MYLNTQVELTNAPTNLGARLEQEMKKQRLKFRFYRDYFGSPKIQGELKDKPLIHYKLRNILDSIRQEIKECLYPKSSDETTRIIDKYEHLLSIENYLERLELIKSSRLHASGPIEMARRTYEREPIKKARA